MTSLNGFGNAFTTFCGHTQIATPSHNVKVGTKYILSIDEYGHHVGAQKKLSVAHFSGNQKIHGAGTYHTGGNGHRLPGIVRTGIHFHNVSVKGVSGFVRHHII